MQGVNNLTRDVGQLQEAVGTLKASMASQEGEIKAIRKRLDIATGVVACAGVIGTLLLGFIAWAVDKGFEQIAAALAP